jgi:signal transduction histidine kinase
MTSESNADLVSALSTTARATSAISIVVGCSVLAGWALGAPTLTSIIPGMATMKINTAIGFVLAGLALWATLVEPGHRSSRRGLVAYGCAAFVALIGLLTLAEYLFAWDLGIDRVPQPGSSTANNVIATSRMAHATAMCFLLLGSALLLLDTRRGRQISRWLTSGAQSIALLALLGYLYGVQSLYALVPYASMALHTALTFALLSVGVFCARPDRGATAILIGQGAGSVLMRRLLPAAIAAPLILGWLRLAGQEAGLYDTAFGLALFALSNIIVFTLLIWRNAINLNRADHERRLAERRVQRFNEELEQRVIERTTQLSTANQQLEQANLAKNQFMANMSHELRTPLNAIIGFTGTLLMRLPGPLTADQEQQLTTVQSSAKHLLALINDLLDLTRIEAGKRELRLEPVASREVIAEVIASQRQLALAKGIGLEIDERTQDISLLTDRRVLSQILLNLVNNAIKFTEHGRVVVSVRTEGRGLPTESELPPLGVRTEGRGLPTESELPPLSPQSSVLFSVTDTGSGIRQEDQHKLFQVFTQVDGSTTRQHEGTGLGLYLSQKLAALLGGQIDFQSEFGQGSTFTLTIADRRPVRAEFEPERALTARIESNGTWPRS